MLTKKIIAYAFFDVDGTIISINSLLSFLEYVVARHFNNANDMWIKKYREQVDSYGQNVSRERLNELYYKNFEGIDINTIRQYGVDWFHEFLNKEEIFNQKCLMQLQQHKQKNHCVVLVSGGFFATLEPLAKYLDIRHILCVEMFNFNRVLTGKINLNTQTIGVGKAKAIQKFMQSHNSSDLLPMSYAYGDHISDYEMLSSVGNPIVVGNDAEMLAIADKKGWRILN